MPQSKKEAIPAFTEVFCEYRGGKIFLSEHNKKCRCAHCVNQECYRPAIDNDWPMLVMCEHAPENKNVCRACIQFSKEQRRKLRRLANGTKEFHK